MSHDLSREPILDMFIFESFQMLEQLEQIMLQCEKSNSLDFQINEIFRIMHTIKGSASMMMFNNIASLSHSVEDLFYLLRENKPKNIESKEIIEFVLKSIDFFKIELNKIESGKEPGGEASELIEAISEYITTLKVSGSSEAQVVEEPQKSVDTSPNKFYLTSTKARSASQSYKYNAVIFFEDGCEMENIRAYTVIHNLKEIASEIQFSPSDIINSDESVDIIRNEGFKISFNSELKEDEIKSFLSQTIFLKQFELSILEGSCDKLFPVEKVKKINLDETYIETSTKPVDSKQQEPSSLQNTTHNFISVSTDKLDKLMDMMGELVISEAMVTRNSDLEGLILDGFNKASRQHQKIIGELQDIVMSIRMVPLSATFHKMDRIVRDMRQKLKKAVELEIIGEETEVDKNLIEHISDPLMHLVRNSIDHGLESSDERIASGKPENGRITLEAKNVGSEVWIVVKDDGRGLDKEMILKKAMDNGLFTKPVSELTDKEIYSFIILPGFSTKESVTEYSGRGVGMDVVVKNIEKVNGSLSIDSIPGESTTVTIRIPLTLAIIDGMTIKAGNSLYTIPTISIKESFRINENDVIIDPDGNEILLIRGRCYPICRLYKRFSLENTKTSIPEGIIVMVENDRESFCIFADELVGQQQVVVKTLPIYIKKVEGVSGCTLLGDGNISLILDVAGLINQ